MQLRIGPVDAADGVVHRQPGGPLDAVLDQNLPLAPVHVCALDAGLGAPIRPRQDPSDWVHHDVVRLLQIIVEQRQLNVPVQAGHQHAGRRRVHDVQLAGHPVDGDSSGFFQIVQHCDHIIRFANAPGAAFRVRQLQTQFLDAFVLVVAPKGSQAPRVPQDVNRVDLIPRGGGDRPLLQQLIGTVGPDLVGTQHAQLRLAGDHQSGGLALGLAGGVASMALDHVTGRALAGVVPVLALHAQVRARVPFAGRGGVAVEFVAVVPAVVEGVAMECGLNAVVVRALELRRGALAEHTTLARVFVAAVAALIFAVAHCLLRDAFMVLAP